MFDLSAFPGMGKRPAPDPEREARLRLVVETMLRISGPWFPEQTKRMLIPLLSTHLSGLTLGELRELRNSLVAAGKALAEDWP